MFLVWCIYDVVLLIVIYNGKLIIICWCYILIRIKIILWVKKSKKEESYL